MALNSHRRWRYDDAETFPRTTIHTNIPHTSLHNNGGCRCNQNILFGNKQWRERTWHQTSLSTLYEYWNSGKSHCTHNPLSVWVYRRVVDTRHTIVLNAIQSIDTITSKISYFIGKSSFLFATFCSDARVPSMSYVVGCRSAIRVDSTIVYT